MTAKKGSMVGPAVVPGITSDLPSLFNLSEAVSCGCGSNDSKEKLSWVSLNEALAEERAKRQREKADSATRRRIGQTVLEALAERLNAEQNVGLLLRSFSRERLCRPAHRYRQKCLRSLLLRCSRRVCTLARGLRIARSRSASI
jgi:hypothetical protein